MLMTAAVLAEICSALPLSGSIYIWAAESAGPEHARFFGFVVAWWSCTSWMTFAASNCQVNAFVSCWLHTPFLTIRSPLDDRQFYRIPTSSMGNSLPGRYHKREHQMASPHLGDLRRPAHSIRARQLFTPKDVFSYLQIRDRHHDAWFLPLGYLAPNCGFEDIRVPLCWGSFHNNLYVS